MKKILSVALGILMLVTLFTGAPRTASADTASGQCGDNLYWSYASNRLTITGSGAMYDFPDGAPWLGYKDEIKWIYLPEGLTSIGAGAFFQCASLVWIELPDSVTTIKSWSFFGCSTMRSISLPRGLVEIEDLAFSQCSGLKNVYYLGTETMKEDLTVDWANNANLRDATWWYLGDHCGDNLLWSYNSATHKLTITGSGEYWDIYEEMPQPWSCYRHEIEEIELPENIPLVYPGSFAGLTALESIMIPEGVTRIGLCAFQNCTSLQSATLPHSLEEIDEYAFMGCTALTDIYYNGADPERDDIDIDWSDSDELRNATWHYLSDKIGENLRYEYNEVTHTLRIIGTGNMWGYMESRAPWFDYRSEIISVELPDGLTNIGDNIFVGLTALDSIEIPEGVTKIGILAFQNCISLQSVTLPHSLKKIDEYAFMGCTALTDIYYNGADPERDDIDIDWSDSDELRNATWHYLSDKIGENLRYEYDEATHTLRIIGTGNMWGYMESRVPWFDYRSEITSVELPEGLTNIGGLIFNCLTSLEEITIPDGVTYIGMFAFTGCTALEKVTFTNSVQNIYQGAFCNCTALTDVYYYGTVADREEIVIDWEDNECLQSATWHYLFDGTIEWDASDVQFKGTTPYVVADGQPHTPRFTVKAADGREVDSANYTYEFRENQNPGTGYVILTFTSEYMGTARAFFKIYLPATTSTTVENRSAGIYLTWKPVEGAAGYVIYRRAWSTTTDGWTTFERWNNTTELNWTDTKVYAGTRYQYGIKAYFAQRTDPVTGALIGGNVGDNFNLGEVGPLKTTVRITTRELKSVTAGTKQITVKWTPSKNFTGYQIQYATDKSFKRNATAIKIADPKAAQTVIKNLTSGKTYYVRIRSYHVINGMTYFGGWSSVKNCKVK